jgi:AcrR family transcriptional regulator
MRRKQNHDLERLVESCLAAFISAGSLDLSLDQLAAKVRVSKRMLIHYFASRDNLEEKVLGRLEERLRDSFRPDRFPAGATLETIVTALWEQSTAPESRGVLLLVMDASRRGWSGSERAKAFYAEQQQLWVELLIKYLPDEAAVEELLQLFQGAILAYLVTGDSAAGKRALARMAARESGAQKG